MPIKIYTIKYRTRTNEIKIAEFDTLYDAVKFGNENQECIEILNVWGE